MDPAAILPVLTTWGKLFDAWQAFDDPKSQHYQNTRRGCETFLELSQWLLTVGLPQIETWCATLLAERPQEVWIRYWLHYGNQHLCMDSYDWTRTDSLHPLMALWDTKDPRFSFQVAKAAKEAAMARRQTCEDPAITAIHAGKACESNGWFCDWCEDVEIQWTRSLGEELRAKDNIFLNKEWREEWIQAWLQQQQSQRPSTPPKVWKTGKYGGWIVGNAEEALRIARQRRADDAAKGKTPMANLRSFMDVVTSEPVRLSPPWKPQDPWCVFAALWGKPEVLKVLLEEDQERVLEILGDL